MGMEVIGVDETGQMIVWREKSPRKASFKGQTEDKFFTEETQRCHRCGKRIRRLWAQRRKFQKVERDQPC